MKNRITKFATIASIVLVFVLGVIFLDKSATPVYGITEALNLYKNAETIHIHGWAYIPTKSKEKQEFVKVPFEHWFDVENGCYKIIKPGGIDEKTGSPKYLTTISDGEYIMSEVYHYPVNGEPSKSVRFQKLTEFQSRLQAHNNSYNFIMQMFGGIDKIQGFSNVGNETIKGRKCYIWQGEIATPHPQGHRLARIKGWISHDTGELLKVQTWMEVPDTDSWSPMFEIDQIDLNIELPQGLFETEPPQGCEVDITKEDAPFAEIGLMNRASSRFEDLALYVHIGFTLSDGSVILCWRSTNKAEPEQKSFFDDVSPGGDLPELPMVIHAVAPMANIDIEYPGYHLAHTFKDNKYYEWSIYVPANNALSRDSMAGYELLKKFNVEKKDKLIGTEAAAYHEDIQIETEEDFNIWILGAMAELSDDGQLPEGISYESVLDLIEDIRLELEQ